MSAVLLLTATLATGAGHPPPRAVREPDVHVTPGWLVSQLIPSPGVGFGDDGAHLALGWQLTPVLYSFWLDPRLSPWRWFVVEPLVRQGGSMELFLAPEYRTVADDRFDFRIGLRSYFPLLERGDVLSLSLATAYQQAGDTRSPSYEAGLHTLFGLFGITQQYAPVDPVRRWTTLFKVRVF